jgi:hypothetical protein
MATVDIFLTGPIIIQLPTLCAKPLVLTMGSGQRQNCIKLSFIGQENNMSPPFGEEMHDASNI